MYLHHLVLLAGDGVPVLAALSTARSVLSNQALQWETDRMITAVTAGEDQCGVW